MPEFTHASTAQRTTQISGWLRARVTAAGARGLVVGLSGRLDSAVVLRLCQLAAPGQVLGVILPCCSDPLDEQDARLIADHFGVTAVRVDLEPGYNRIIDELRAAAAAIPPEQRLDALPEEAGQRARLAVGNVQPRLRMAALYHFANALDYLVAGTGNRSELTLGHFTKHGDGGVDLLPLGSLLKSEVRALAIALGVPRAIVDKVPSAGSWPGQRDERETGCSYDDLERYFIRGPEGVPPALALRLERLIRASEHKRGMAPTPE